MPDLLRVERVSKHFSGTQALDDVSLTISAGEVHALVGENGAGKSTLAKIVAGVVTPDSGGLIWRGEPVRFANPLEAQRRGVGIIFQELDLFPHLTVADNIVIGNLEADRGVLLNRRRMEQFCAPLIEEVGLSCSPWRLLADLSLSQMQLLAIARALGMNARVIVMDEPTSSLSDDGVGRLFALIRELTAKGVSIIYVSHKMDEIFRIAHRISVLRDGKMIGTLTTVDTDANQVIAMMVGRELQDSQKRDSGSSGDVLLRLESLSTAKLRDVTFELHAGEVLGIAGLVGSGRSSLGAALFGLQPLTGGTIEMRGRKFFPRAPSDAVRHGIGFVPEDRKTQGLMMHMSVVENATMQVIERLQTMRFIRRGDERRVAGEALGRLRLKAPSVDSAVGTLSGGNQQKVLLARWLLRDPDVLFLDDPARGIDIGAKHDIYDAIDELRASGKGILFVSSELPELLRCSDRVIVLQNGRIAGSLDRSEATPERIMSLAVRAQ